MRFKLVVTTLVSITSLGFTGCGLVTKTTSALKDGCFGQNCEGFVYSPGGQAGARIGEHGDYGSLGVVNGKAAWFGDIKTREASKGCLTYGPYLNINPSQISYFHVEAHLSGYICLLEKDWRTDKKCGDVYPYSPLGNVGGKYTVDVVGAKDGVLAGEVFWSRTFYMDPVHENHIKTEGFHAGGGKQGIEIRVCHLAAAMYSAMDEYIPSRAVLGIHDIRILGSSQ